MPSKIWTVPVSGKENLEFHEGDGANHVNTHGISMLVTGLMLVGEMAGGGIVAMPYAMEQSSWGGVAIIVVGALLTGYTGCQLGWSWTILQDIWPEYRKQCRKPYPTIGEKAVGKWIKYVCSVAINITLFGTACVFLLLASENISLLIEIWTGKHISFCILLIAVAALLLPLTFLGSPKDFWPAVVGAMISTTVAVILILVGIGLDHGKNGTIQHDPITFKNFALAFATISFAYGGHAAFPTIQHDMKKPAKFPKSVIIGYSIILCMYLPVSIAGYTVYGNLIQNNLLKNISTTWLEETVTVLITLHVILSYVIVANPVNQEIEEVLRIPKRFNKWRVLSRTVVMLALLFLAETVPRFGVVLDLIGGSTITLLNYIFPCIFYMSLTRIQTQKGLRENKYGGYFNIHWAILLLDAIVIVVGVVGGASATYAALLDVIQPSGGNVFTLPCYVNSSAS